MAITDWPTHERPREKLLQYGANSLSDAELLAIFLRTGIRGKTAVDLASDILRHFNGLRALLDANLESVCSYRGLGLVKFAQLQAALEISRRHLLSTLKRSDAMAYADQTGLFLLSKMRHYQQEVFACLFLDTQYRVIVYEELFYGTIDYATVHPRIVVKRALFHNAAAVIFAHNHPSGIAEPSDDDKNLTQLLKSALEIVDIKVLDHFIIGENHIVSMLQKGLITN